MKPRPARVRFQNGLSGLFAGDEGPAVVLLHPIGLSAHTWRHVQPALAAECRTLALDLLGFGMSAKPRSADYSVQAHAEHVWQVLDELDWDRVDFVGNSLGGVVSLAASTLAAERVASLTLISPAAYPGGLPPLRLLAHVPLAEHPLRLSSRLAAPWVMAYCFANRRRMERGPVGLYTDVLATPEGIRAFRLTGQAIFGPSLTSLVSRYHSIRCPALILQGDRDPIIPRWVPERLCRDLPRSELRWLSHVGHFPQEEDPQQLLDHVLTFLLRRDRAAA